MALGDGNSVRRAMEAAHQHGMRFILIHSKADRADIFCRKCGWPRDNRETVISKYIDEPYGCADCSRESPENFRG